MEIDLLKPLFEEFKYRHELFWKLLGGLSIAILTLDAIPFLKDGPYDLKKLTQYLFMFPLVAAVIAISGGILLFLEYRLIANVEIVYNAKKSAVDLNASNSGILDHRCIGYSVVLVWFVGFFTLSVLEAWVIKGLLSP